MGLLQKRVSRDLPEEVAHKSLVWYPPHRIEEEGSGDIRCSNIPATLLFCNYIGAISIYTKRWRNTFKTTPPFNASIYTSIVYVCHQTLPPLCEGAGTGLMNHCQVHVIRI